MSFELKPLTITLPMGHRDKDGALHTAVTFGRMITGRDLFTIDSDPQSQLQTQYDDLVLRTAITGFGTLKMPIGLNVLLGLDSIDREDLSDGFNNFSKANRDGAEAQIIDDRVLKLGFGYESNGLVYDRVEFGRRLTGMDQVEADKRKLDGIRRVCFLAGRQIVKLSQSDGASELTGPVELDVFEKLFASDIQSIRVASEVYRQSFRRPGARV